MVMAPGCRLLELMAKGGAQDVRIMIDTGASSSYVCFDVTELSLKLKRREQRCIGQMYETSVNSCRKENYFSFTQP